MHVRPAEQKDLDILSQICMESFDCALANTLPAAGRDTFKAIATPAAIAARLAEDNQVLVAEIAGKPVGMLELKAGRHIAMLFVAPAHQHKGVGKALINVAFELATEQSVTVSASLSSVGAYQKYGFELAGEVAESGGLVYRPMEASLP
ncbi:MULTISPECIES: GNAT family N-acetyltransferase [unclassified Pseudoalteromonas]|uniref:GNAT family N-acetyltransferase n=1 Tax=unclassified Pseudoalteromonas TaxID=194690 RepID=UPI002097C5B2|nr:GNAT family N-acetyltransferase [Pseudoalteromonas sp. XMcav2-N]MCO7189590.1 GNAT family N-acetyltransferase [Pseudoalteromonas sp. XMcav2-N]